MSREVRGKEMASGTQGKLEIFASVCADHYGTARAAAERAEKVAGYMCTYTPIELLHAAGYLPVRIFGREGAISRADGHLQVFACTLARSALDMALSGELGFLRLMAFPHTCDTIQNLAEIWKENMPETPVLTVSTPVWVDSEHALEFYREELARARRFLEAQIGTEISDGSIDASIKLHDEHRSMMRRLYEVRRARPGSLSGAEMLSVVLASFLMPREEHLRAVTELVGDLESVEPEADSSLPKVVVIGAACRSEDYLAVIEDAGCIVVDDELCTGSRAFAIEPVADGDTIERLARMYLTRIPCASKHCPGFDRSASLVEKVRRSGADAVVFLYTKFCDPWAFDYPYLRDALDESGIPSLLVEIEQNVPPAEQIKTRFSAFAEMIGAAAKG
jgi:bcr-type benzoyl-CoA reductase subunit C